MAETRQAGRGRTAPAPLALTLRRHIDLARVSSAACR
ncbi:putative leader peptide [Streptomyces sp. PTD5-9]